MHPRATLLTFLSLIQWIRCIWPLPTDVEHGSSVCWFSPDLALAYAPKDKKSPWTRLQNVLGRRSAEDDYHQWDADCVGDTLVKGAFNRLKEDIGAHAFVPWKFHPKGADFEPEMEGVHAKDANQMKSVRVKYGSGIASSGSHDAYSLSVSKDCELLVRANHPLGALRAFNTFTQLFYRHSNRDLGMYMDTAPLTISDAPTFEHRGLNLDISRNIISPQDVMRTVDALAFNKFNRVHLHASDAQSWVLEIPSIPELAAQGAYHESQVWTAADLHDVHEFGAARGVQVYIEIDMPGHTASIQQSHPELLTSFNRKPWEEYSAQPPSGQLKLNNTAVTTFITTLLSNLLPRTKPFSPLFHLGGDEITATAYNMTVSEVRPFLQAFMSHACSLVHSHALTPVVWEEHILDYNLTLPRDTIVQAWRGATPDRRSSLAELVGRGHRAIFGSNDHWYLDCGLGGWIDRDVSNPESPIKSPFLDYCAPYKNWREVLDYEPLKDIPKSQQHLVVGGEIHMWGEQTDGANLDSSLWPRVAAAGEVLWSGKGAVGENATRRLAEMREWLVQKGVGAGPVQVTWCLMNPGNCVL